MPTFQYTARDMTGKSVQGSLEAASQREATSLLTGRDLFPTKIAEQASGAGLSIFGKKRKKVKGQVMATFYGQLASLLRSGVPMIRSLTILGEQSSTPVLGEVLAEIRGRVEDGEPIGDTMGRYPGVFSDMAVNMVRAGTEGGFLEDALDRVGVFTELQEDLKGRTVSAMAYPVFLFTIGSVVISALLVFFVPKFDMLFDRLRQKGEMPAMTEALLGFSNFLQGYGWILIVLAIGLIIFFRQQLQTDKGQDLFDKIKLKVPVLGDILMNLSVARFCRVLGTLLANGVPILKSLDISRTATGNRLLSQSIADASENIRSGESLAKPLRQSGYFPISVVEMISVGEESNSLDRVLPEIADSLEKRTFRRLDLFVRLLEPIMLLVMAILVLAVVMALLVPVLKSSTSL
ncbi:MULTISPECIES: type II secretion system F family protein [Rhodopirellula]|uniref:Type IV pilus biogenesis protein PilC n=2 Tax=Rhodopirellula TaxID=265488 RepID=M5S1B1_9BACT|nr:MULTISPECIES: type II secretion system F family protein [Rhodopirellula]EMI25241.1 type IV pilus biogenesis protein PilC [Rhodopirellula europaea SH398]PHQ32721.1 pilus assembly protein PilC [Rhodopirellula bahusiensis]